MVAAPRAELIWASPREVLNVVQADQVGCHIITVTTISSRSLTRWERTWISSRSRPSRCSVGRPVRRLLRCRPMSVIFSRAPLRISLGGGGTDLPSYYREHGGFLVAGAIDKYVYMLMHTSFQRRYRMKYSETEDVEGINEIRHPILRETLRRHWRGQPAGDRLCRRRPGRHRDGLLGCVHGRAAQGSGTRASDLHRPGPARRGCLGDRDRRSSTSPAASRIRTLRRTAGSAVTRSMPTGTVEVSRWSSLPRPCAAARPAAVVLHRRGSRRIRRALRSR